MGLLEVISTVGIGVKCSGRGQNNISPVPFELLVELCDTTAAPSIGLELVTTFVLRLDLGQMDAVPFMRLLTTGKSSLVGAHLSFAVTSAASAAG